MNRLLALASAVVLVTACAGSGRDGDKLDSGYASPDAAAFMGYHGPLDRQNNRNSD